MGRIGRVALCALVGAVLLAGCAVVERGTAVPDAREMERLAEPLTARDVLGELATIDYCTTLDLAVMEATGGTVRWTQESFGWCEFGVVAEEGRVVLRVGDLAEVSTSVLGEPDGTVAQPHGWRMERYADLDPEACYRFLVFPDGISLQVEVTRTDVDPDVPVAALCRVAEVAVGAARAWLVEKPPTRLPLREGSLGHLDACALVPQPEVEAAVGGPAPARPTPTGHSCLWGRWDLPGPAALVAFTVRVVESEEREDEFPETVAGRAAAVLPADDTCLVETPHIDFDPDVPGEVEVVGVEARPAEGDACAAARALAERVWAALPAA
ncbi:Protein of unknown function [Amycolatopsis arida]|uniref:DUF3558 domain-containing protein n=1 Tax=Amycolatopsis arida TaxID=587909 RepID=A0A1I5L5P2_9PSEU|nr:DUF3558 family protein [Amycolatopsis arida]TDX93590.1 uncharacterized protein DUF3558 [Amycolatopsis arida]SFO92528.1 Protein of unknown function [Amycolatopsis arida]